MGLIGRCHIEEVGLKGVSNIEEVGLIHRCMAYLSEEFQFGEYVLVHLGLELHIQGTYRCQKIIHSIRRGRRGRRGR
jgi:hydrogenase maturation factor